MYWSWGDVLGNQVLKLFIMTLLLYSCGGDQQPIAEDLKVGPEIQFDLTEVDFELMSSPKNQFHETGLSFERKANITVSLYRTMSRMDPDTFVLNVHSKLNLINSESMNEPIDYGTNVFAAKLRNDHIAVIEADENNHLMITRLDLQGNLLYSQKLLDSEYNNDKCYDEFDLGVGGKKCLKSQNGEVKLYSHYMPYQAVKILASPFSNDEVYILVDTHRSASVIYHLKLSQTGFTLLNRKQVFVHNHLILPIIWDLISGSELHTLNRYGRRLEKIFAMNDMGELVFGVALSTPLPMNKFLNVKPFSDEKQNYTYFAKFDSSLKKLDQKFFGDINVGPANYLVSSHRNSQELVIGKLAHQVGSNNQFDYQLFQLNTKDMSLVAGANVNLAGSDYLTALDYYDGKVYAASFSGVSQNPSGMSIGGFGAVALSAFNEKLELEKTIYFKLKDRKNILQQFNMNNTGLVGSFDLDGPVTHTADANEELNRQMTGIYSVDLSPIFN